MSVISQDDLTFAKRLADAAAAETRPRFLSRGLAVEMKQDASPVSEADRAAETALRRLIQAERPEDGIVGEEFDDIETQSGDVWVLDPIDGTKSFITGRPLFTTLIALLREGRPVLGVIDQPIVQQRWIGAQGLPSTCNDKAIRTRSCPDIAKAWFAATMPDPDSHNRQRAERVISCCAGSVWGGDAYSYGLLASGLQDIMIESDLKIYDFAALVPVIEGAGGKICDWSGNPLTTQPRSDVVALGDASLCEKVLEILQQ